MADQRRDIEQLSRTQDMDTVSADHAADAFADQKDLAEVMASGTDREQVRAGSGVKAETFKGTEDGKIAGRFAHGTPPD